MRRLSPLLALLVLTACSSSDVTAEPTPVAPPAEPAPTTPGIVAELRADSNRDGDVRFDESDAQRTTWDAKAGAIFLANIDDDRDRCKKEGEDVALAKCNDAANDVIDGANDVLDLARLKTKPWPEAPDDVTATIEVEGGLQQVRLFKRTGPEATDFEVLEEDATLTAEEIRAGIELAIEAKDIVRDREVWDGFTTVKLTVTTSDASASDAVKMRVAPVLTYHHLLPAEEVFVTNNGSSGNRALRTDLRTACKMSSLPDPTEIDDGDPWAQDFFETAFMSMPGPAGKQHVVRVNLRSANVYYADPSSPLRAAGQIVFTGLRGKDSAGVQQFDAEHSRQMDSLNSFGNLETVPPYTMGEQSYPFGRLLRGKTKSFYPDPTFTKMMDSQSIQPAIDIDTSWLLVGHVDETLSFVKAKTPRGWVLLVDDPASGRALLEAQVAAGHGNTPMFVGKAWFDDRGRSTAAEKTIEQVLADTTVMAASAEAAAEIAGQVKKLKAETGLTDAEIVLIPGLHTASQGVSMAYLPGMVNGIYVADGRFVAPKPHGPQVEGKDVFEQAMIEKLAPLGINVFFAEDWEYHAGIGEVHCGTNTRRKIPESNWWESGR